MWEAHELRDLGRRAFEENNPDAVRFLINKGHTREWELFVIGVLETDGSRETITWLLKIWPELPWIEFITLMLRRSIEYFDCIWPRALITLVPYEQVFSAPIHIPLIIAEWYSMWFPCPDDRNIFWMRLLHLMDVVGGRGLKEAIGCAAKCPIIKRALIRYVAKRRCADLEVRDILRLLIPADDVVDIIMKHADFVV